MKPANQCRLFIFLSLISGLKIGTDNNDEAYKEEESHETEEAYKEESHETEEACEEESHEIEEELKKY